MTKIGVKLAFILSQNFTVALTHNTEFAVKSQTTLINLNI